VFNLLSRQAEARPHIVILLFCYCLHFHGKSKVEWFDYQKISCKAQVMRCQSAISVDIQNLKRPAHLDIALNNICITRWLGRHQGIAENNLWTVHSTWSLGKWTRWGCPHTTKGLFIAITINTQLILYSTCICTINYHVFFNIDKIKCLGIFYLVVL
jgi:hypothetical protein